MMRPSAFVSYSNTDREKVRGLVQALIENGWYVHVDSAERLGVPLKLRHYCKSIEERRAWQAELGHLMTTCDLAVLCLSDHYLTELQGQTTIATEVQVAVANQNWFCAWLEDCKVSGAVAAILRTPQREHRLPGECETMAEFHLGVVHELSKPRRNTGSVEYSQIAQLADRDNQVGDVRSYLARSSPREAIIISGAPEDMPCDFAEALAKNWMPLCFRLGERERENDIREALLLTIQRKPDETWDYKPYQLHAETYRADLERFWPSMDETFRLWSRKKGFSGGVIHMRVPERVWNRPDARRRIAEIIKKRPEAVRDREGGAVFLISVESKASFLWRSPKPIEEAYYLSPLPTLTEYDLTTWMQALKGASGNLHWGRLDNVEAIVRDLSASKAPVRMRAFATRLRRPIPQAAMTRKSR